jgi:hypothetical protein
LKALEFVPPQGLMERISISFGPCSIGSGPPVSLRTDRRSQNMRVDAYHHLWRYTPSAFDWIDERMQSLRRDFLLIDLEPELAAASVDTTVVFQAR